MRDDPELLRLRDYARNAEDRYLRLKTLLGDPATLTAAQRIRDDALEAVRAYEEKSR